MPGLDLAPEQDRFTDLTPGQATPTSRGAARRSHGRRRNGIATRGPRASRTCELLEALDGLGRARHVRAEQRRLALREQRGLRAGKQRAGFLVVRDGVRRSSRAPAPSGRRTGAHRTRPALPASRQARWPVRPLPRRGACARSSSRPRRTRASTNDGSARSVSRYKRSASVFVDLGERDAQRARAL